LVGQTLLETIQTRVDFISISIHTTAIVIILQNSLRLLHMLSLDRFRVCIYATHFSLRLLSKVGYKFQIWGFVLL